MKKILNLNSENVYDIMDILEYGSNLITYESEYIRDILKSNLAIINEVLGQGAVKETPCVKTDILDNQYQHSEVLGVYNIIYSIRGEVFEPLSKDSYMIAEYLNSSIRKKEKVYFNLDERLHKYAHRLASRSSVKFGVDSKGVYFNGLEKDKPIFKQLEESYNRGDDSISFDSSKAHTIRCYASTFGSTQGRKFRCAISGERITVFFKELSKEDELFSKLKILQAQYMPTIGHSGFWGVWRHFETSNFSEGRFIEDLDEVERYDLERDYEAEALEAPTRNIEGLQQYYSPELEDDSPNDFTYRQVQQLQKELGADRESINNNPNFSYPPDITLYEEDDDF